jgi:hypothetical protein
VLCLRKQTPDEHGGKMLQAYHLQHVFGITIEFCPACGRAVE